MRGMLLAAVAGLLLTACTDAGPIVSGLLDLQLTIVGDQDRAGPVGEELPDPVTVLVERKTGNHFQPAPGVTVNFVVAEGGGRVYAGTGVTDRDGLASDYWTLGPDAGLNRLEVRTVSGDGTKNLYGEFMATAFYTLTHALVAHYPLDGDGTDASGNGLDGNVQGPAATLDRNGTAGGAMLFDGVNDHIKISHDPSLNSESLGVSAWFRLDGSGSSIQALVSHHGTGSALDPYLVRVHPGGTLWVYLEGNSPSGPVQLIILSHNPITAGQWHHVAVSYDAESGVAQLYVDGLMVKEETQEMTLHTNNIGVMLGGDMWANGSPRADYLEGALDEVRLYSRPLTAADVQALCDVPSICSS